MIQPEQTATPDIGFVLFPNIKPTIATGSLFRDIDPEHLLWHLRQRGRPKAGAIDLDSTVVPQEAMRIPDEEVAVIKGFFELGVPLGIDSNAASESRGYRVELIALDLSERVGEDI